MYLQQWIKDEYDGCELQKGLVVFYIFILIKENNI